MSIQKALPELPSEVWLDIFDKVGPTPHIPCVCRYFKELYTTRVTRWAERIVDHLEDCYKEQSPARGIPRGSAVTYDQANVIIKYFKNKINAVRSQLSSDEQDRCKISLAVHPESLRTIAVRSQLSSDEQDRCKISLAVHPESLSTILPIIDEVELIKLLPDKLPIYLILAPRSEKMSALTALTILDLYQNKLTSLPDSIGKLTALTQLYLSHNQLTSLPSSIGNLTALTRLDLDTNQLTTLPDSIGNLTQLTQLDLSHNKLTILPVSIGNLTQLTMLALYNNRLITLPNSIGNLTLLRYLYTSENHSLAQSPQSLIQLRRLQENGCDVRCDAVVDSAIEALPEISGEPPAKQQKCLIQ